MTCALCRQERELQNSHILPELFYKSIYDALHRCHFISTDPLKRETYVQKGLRERLLCKECEQKFSRWEHYAKEAFVDAKGVKIVRNKNQLVLEGIDYKSFKLFQLSLLWRMGVSSLEFYKEVDLGPHQERIRLALLGDNPLEPNQYPCVLVTIQIDGKFCPGWILTPSLVRFDGIHCYRLVINGILFSFFTASHCPAAVSPILLNKKGRMVIVVEEMRNVPFLAEAAFAFSRAREQRRVPAEARD